MLNPRSRQDVITLWLCFISSAPAMWRSGRQT